MPYHDPDASDPMTLTGVGLPGDAQATEGMAYTFAEEYAQMAYSEEEILGIFQSPFYRSPHDAYTALGEETVRSIICECVAVWGSVRFVDDDSAADRSVEAGPGSKGNL